MPTLHANDDSFEADVLRSGRPVLVDFWAEWCGPCRQIAPMLEEIAEERAEGLAVVKINIDDSPMVTGRFAVRGVPTLMLFQNGKVLAKRAGALPKSQLLQWVDDAQAQAAAS